MAGRIHLSPGERWAELWTDMRPAASERVGAFVFGTIRAAGDATGRERGLFLEILGRTIELESGSGRAGETHAFRIGEEGGRIFLEPLGAPGGDAIDAAIRHLGRLPDAQGREIANALIAQGLPITEEAFAAVERAVAMAGAGPAAAARAGALLIAADLPITARMLAASLLALAPWPEVFERLAAAAAVLRGEAARLDAPLPDLNALLVPPSLAGAGGADPDAAILAQEVRAFVDAGAGDALDAIGRLVDAALVRGELPERMAQAAREWIAFFDAHSLLAAQGILGREDAASIWALFALPSPEGDAPSRVRFDGPRRASDPRRAHRAVIDVAFPSLGRVWGEVTLEGRAARARFRAERPRVRRTLRKGMADLAERIARQGIALAGTVDAGAPPPRAAAAPRIEPPPVEGLDVQA
ncbi:MAG: flagellar hook-length control protein FliK [Planctomycetes bacterium]|nr:flagellar hook-length control protein FliK [Planctomycetota bacterium]